MHPNLVTLLRVVLRRMEIRREAATDLDDTRVFLASLAKLSKTEQDVVLRLLLVASIVDGRLTRAERRLLREAYDACGRRFEPEGTERLRRAFLAGEPIEKPNIAALWVVPFSLHENQQKRLVRRKSAARVRRRSKSWAVRKPFR